MRKTCFCRATLGLGGCLRALRQVASLSRNPGVTAAPASGAHSRADGVGGRPRAHVGLLDSKLQRWPGPRGRSSLSAGPTCGDRVTLTSGNNAWWEAGLRKGQFGAVWAHLRLCSQLPPGGRDGTATAPGPSAHAAATSPDRTQAQLVQVRISSSKPRARAPRLPRSTVESAPPGSALHRYPRRPPQCKAFLLSGGTS